MNYSEKLKEKETYITNLKANLIAKKQSIEDALNKRNKLEEECKLKFNISLSDVPDKIEKLTTELAEGYQKLEDECDALERKLKELEK